MVSNAVFTMMRTVISAFGKNYTPSPMEVLHSMALKELEKEGDPDWEYLDAFLERMEGVAEENKNESGSMANLKF